MYQAEAVWVCAVSAGDWTDIGLLDWKLVFVHSWRLHLYLRGNIIFTPLNSVLFFADRSYK